MSDAPIVWTDYEFSFLSGHQAFYSLRQDRDVFSRSVDAYHLTVYHEDGLIEEAEITVSAVAHLRRLTRTEEPEPINPAQG